MGDDDYFMGWAVAGLALSEEGFRLRIFTIGTYHEEDAVRYARSEMERDWPGWAIYTATYAMTAKRIVEV